MNRIEKAYAKLGKLVFKTAWKFSKQYRRDPDETIGDANAIFVEAFRRFNPKRQTLEGWVVYKITMELTGILRNELRRAKLLKRVESDLETMPDIEQRTFDLIDFLEGLNEDAQEVVRLIFDTPKPVARRVKNLGGPTPRNLRVSIRRWLRSSGWSRRRVEASFRQIAEAL